ncbi:alpha-ribazole-5-phosphate synthase [Planococcus donghaensis]|uniref:Alpha-ribazole-5-phosphate synthase n=1 Tax=Planococcus donghaensis TaxID=414778 RepID=A0A1C7EFE3_9BACL|nr:alpha-ribazole-5-phosphate synthase [Planococcus donghaensis]ANU22386.1 alpha-ribazole-5-phosphate synthase [Planococcus donghaensis]
MRHELLIDGLVITSDNSAAIGRKEQDVVQVSDTVTAKFAARVALLEQWAAGSEPQAVLIHNFSGASSWEAYVEGVTELFVEAQLVLPAISGSTETNMPTVQSGIAVTMIGKELRKYMSVDSLDWFVYGVPLVGQEVLTHVHQTANLALLKKALDTSLVERIWPVGSKGISKEFELLMKRPVKILTSVDSKKSSGPASCVLVGVQHDNLEQARRYFGEHMYSIQFV